MVSTGLLILTTPLRVLSPPINSILQSAHNHVKKTLYIHILPGKVDVRHSDKFSFTKLISLIYASAHNICYELDVRIFLDNLKSSIPVKRDTKNQFEIILTSSSLQTDMKYFIQNRFYQTIENIPVVQLPFADLNTHQQEMEDISVSEKVWQDYKFVVLGGTFDRLHSGHKILLTEAVMRCRQKLTVGVTDETMVKKKILRELIQPTAIRIDQVVKFLEDVDSTIKYNVTPISDPFGPSIVDPELQCIVVSEETVQGGQMVNVERQEKRLNKLDIHTIKLFTDYNRREEEEFKISSSSSRMRLLGRRLKNPLRRHDIPTFPYIIGLTGGIASGKTTISKRLEQLGMAVIHADDVAHATYLPGTEVFAKIVSEFGQDIVDADGCINRKKLGGIVFPNPSLRGKLNDIVWPAVEERIKSDIMRYEQLGKKFVVLEIPVLIESGMTRLVHEIWVSIIPREEAIKRIQARNGLTAEQAKQRIDSQISNELCVSHATVVFSTLGDIKSNFIQVQIDRAWRELKEYLSNIASKY